MSARGLAVLLAAAALSCVSPWGGDALRGPVVDGIYTHPSGLFSVWAPYSDSDHRLEQREWKWLFHEEGGDGDDFAWVVFGPAFLDVSAFGVSLRPADVARVPGPFDDMERLCGLHLATYAGTAEAFHEQVLETEEGEILFRLYRYHRHLRWRSAGRDTVSGHAACYLMRRAGQDVFLFLDVPNSIEESSVPLTASTLIDHAWEKQRRFVESLRVHVPPAR